MTVHDLEGKLIAKILEDLQGGRDIATHMKREDALKVFNLVVSILLEEIGKGVRGEPVETPFYDEVMNILRKDCYFCNDKIDPNEDTYTMETAICLRCTMKVANILQAFCINPQSIYPDIRINKNQEVLFEEE